VLKRWKTRPMVPDEACRQNAAAGTASPLPRLRVPPCHASPRGLPDLALTIVAAARALFSAASLQRRPLPTPQPRQLVRKFRRLDHPLAATGGQPAAPAGAKAEPPPSALLLVRLGQRPLAHWCC